MWMEQNHSCFVCRRGWGLNTNEQEIILLSTQQLCCCFTIFWSFLHKHSWEVNSCSTSQEIPVFYGPRWFITMFTRARHWTLYWATWIQCVPLISIYVRFIIVPSHLCFAPQRYKFFECIVYRYSHGGILQCGVRQEGDFVPQRGGTAQLSLRPDRLAL
jgi:hypothetical protein